MMTEENRDTLRKEICPTAKPSTTNPMPIFLGAKPGLRSDTDAGKWMSYSRSVGPGTGVLISP
jgi:hypothetical protein